MIPTYNRCALLPRAIDSVLAQTVPGVEILLCDDGSTDATKEIYSHDPRVTYVHLPHGGANIARNTGIDLAAGKYIAFLDSDDTWEPTMLERQLFHIESSGADIVSCGFARHDGDSVTQVLEKPGFIDYRDLLGGNYITTQTIMGKAECLKVTRFDPTFPRMQDWEYALRLAKNYRFYYFDEVLCHQHVQADSISKKPELALAALRALCQMYQTELKQSLSCAQLLYSTAQTYALECGKKCTQEYKGVLSLISPSRPFRENLYILRFFLSMLWQAIRKAAI